MLGKSTFKNEMKEARLSSWIDNDGVLMSLPKGGKRAVDANLIVGKWWLEMARQKTAVEFWRVDTTGGCVGSATGGLAGTGL